MRLSDIELAERRMVRRRLEGMSVRRLRELAEMRGVDLHGAISHLCIVNILMSQYDKWKEKTDE